MEPQNPRIVKKPTILLAGLSFFGNPFELSGAWTEENEIGRLWKRFMTLYERQPSGFPPLKGGKVGYEVHILHPETQERGEYEIFVGYEVERLGTPSVNLSFKLLPESLYAVFTLQGDEILSDWNRMMIQEWLPASAYQSDLDFSFELYDERFKGMDRLDESLLEVYIPVRPK